MKSHTNDWNKKYAQKKNDMQDRQKMQTSPQLYNFKLLCIV